MNWREERKRLNQWLGKNQTKFKQFADSTTRAKRNQKRKRAVVNVRNWRKRHPDKYRQYLNEAKARYASSEQRLRRPRLAKQSAQLCRMKALFGV